MSSSLRVLSPAAAPTVKPPLPLSIPDSDPVRFGPGFYEEERNEDGPFRWMGSQAVLELEPSPAERYLELQSHTEFLDLSQELAIEAGSERGVLPLPHGWSKLSIRIPPGAAEVRLAANKLFPAEYYPRDPRALAVTLRAQRLHSDARRHHDIELQQRNRVANQREMLAGEQRLLSTPPNLGIDLYGVCNVKPPCVYCEWDWNKELEGHNVEAPFDSEILRQWGEIFDNSSSLVNCSIGEPFMMKNFDELLDVFGDRGKYLEMTTNGQILTERNIKRLLGRDIHLYISLDAATPETYAKLRNDRFDRILENLRRLIQAKGGKQGLPRIHLVFMPMKVNVSELEGFVRLCAELGVDRLVLRPLNYSPSVNLDFERAGHHFVYQRELLPFQELVRVSGRAAELCQRFGVVLADQMDFGGSMSAMFKDEFEAGRSEVTVGEVAVAPVAPSTVPVPAPAPAGPLPSLGSEARPMCEEPWKSLYILRRGVFPCCYGGAPVAPLDGYREAWNSELLQGIRSELAAGRFHRYCLDSPACPIVRKVAEAGELGPSQRRHLFAKDLWRRLDRRLGGLPGRAWRASKWTATRLGRALREPGYVPRHLRRLLARP